MCSRLFVLLVIIAASIMGVVAIKLPHEQLVGLLFIKDFLDFSLPILALGALVKYLCACSKGPSCCCCNKGVSKQGGCQTNP